MTPKRSKRGEWLKHLAPVFITLIVSLGANAFANVWAAATFKAQVTSMAKHQEEQDVLIRQESDSLKTLLQNLPVDYVRRADALRNDAIDKELRDEDRARLTRVEATTLQILENQENRSRR